MLSSADAAHAGTFDHAGASTSAVAAHFGAVDTNVYADQPGASTSLNFPHASLKVGAYQAGNSAFS